MKSTKMLAKRLMRAFPSLLATGLLPGMHLAWAQALPQPSTGLMPNPAQGKRLYEKHCAACHGGELQGAHHRPCAPGATPRGHPLSDQPWRMYQPRVRLTTRTTRSITGTSISTPTTVARAAPD